MYSRSKTKRAVKNHAQRFVLFPAGTFADDVLHWRAAAIVRHMSVARHPRGNAPSKIQYGLLSATHSAHEPVRVMQWVPRAIIYSSSAHPW